MFPGMEILEETDLGHERRLVVASSGNGLTTYLVTVGMANRGLVEIWTPYTPPQSRPGKLRTWLHKHLTDRDGMWF
jgi:hypothetical protein